MMLLRIKSILVKLIPFMIVTVVIISCDEVNRHKALTFFFDGVPPLEGEEIITEQGLTTIGAQKLDGKNQEPEWYVHEPQKDCTTCHGRRRDRGFTRETLLLSPVPNLCYGCHTNYTTSAPIVHGPVAVGQCLFCHNPHKTKIKYLLNEPEPNLCYLCHDITEIRKIPAHQVEQLPACTDCHDVHTSSTEALLKDASMLTNRSIRGTTLIDAGVQKNLAEMEKNQRDSLEQTETINGVIPENNRLSKVFQTTLKLIDQGEVQLARKFLVDLKESMQLTEKEQESIKRVLMQIDSAIAANKDEQSKSENKNNMEQSATTSEKNVVQLSEQKRYVAELYYKSLAFYREGQLEKAREGFIQVLKSGLAPDAMVKTIYRYLLDIDNTLSQRAVQPNR